MTKREGKGAPTRQTFGAIGDIYTDTETGEEYVCTFAYRSSGDKDYDCQWKKTGNVGHVDTIPAKPVPPRTSEIVTVEKPKEEKKQVNEKTAQPARKDYTSYSKKIK